MGTESEKNRIYYTAKISDNQIRFSLWVYNTNQYERHTVDPQRGL